MDSKVILAVILSLITLIVFQYVYAPVETEKAKVSKPGAQITLQPKQLSPVTPAPRPGIDVSSSRDITVSTDLYQATISEIGGRVKGFKLRNYKEKLDDQSQMKELVNAPDFSDYPLGISFLSGALPDINSAVYKADVYNLDIKSKNDQGTLTLTYSTPQGWRFVKRYKFYPDTYKIDLDLFIHNPTAQPVRENIGLDLINRPAGTSDKYSFSGPAAYVNGDLEETKLEDLKEAKIFNGQISWIAYKDGFFISAALPRGAGQNNYVKMMKTADQGGVVTSLVYPSVNIPANGQAELGFNLYFGPKDISYLKQMGSLEQVVDFGWFGIIAKPLLMALKFFDRFAHNYGLAIIILTVLIKIVFWPLTHKSFHSMREMQKLQPKMAKIREKHKDDKQKMNEEIMSLYKTYKVNPFGGCLPMVLQIPVFFALYKVLSDAIELRHAPFIWWIKDLSAPDRLPVGFDIPYLGGGLPILTILMGASMFIQQKMTPTVGDPAQAKIMLFLPVLFTFMFINFPAGLVLYWLVNNILSIGQQYFINKKAA